LQFLEIDSYEIIRFITVCHLCLGSANIFSFAVSAVTANKKRDLEIFRDKNVDLVL